MLQAMHLVINRIFIICYLLSVGFCVIQWEVGIVRERKEQCELGDREESLEYLKLVGVVSQTRVRIKCLLLVCGRK